MKSHRRGIVRFTIVAAIGGITATPVTLAADAGAAAGNDSDAATLQEVVVTATRRSEELSKVPVSVTAMTQESLDERGIKDFQDVARYTPGIAIDNTGTNAISIRGISSSGGAGTTGIYIDDAPIQMRAVGFNPDDTLPKTFDLDRVEVLRGPQGTLFGAGSEGGTVRYILTPAKLSGESTYLRSELSFTQGGTPSEELGVAHGMTLIDGTLGIRASAWARVDGGWINRVDATTGAVTEKNANTAASELLRLTAIWQPIDGLHVVPGVLYQNSIKRDYSTYWTAYSNPAAGQFNNATPEKLPVPDRYLLPTLKMEWQLQHSQIISDTSFYSRRERTAYQGSVYNLSYYQSLGWAGNPNSGGESCGATSVATSAPCDWYPLIDARGLHLPPGFSNFDAPNKITNTQHSWTQELRWQSTDDSARVRWTVGAFWQQSRETSLEELNDPQINQFFQYLYGVNATDVFGPYYSCNGQGSYTAIPQCDIYYNWNATTDRQLAGFGELSIALTDQIRLTLGERVARTSFSLAHYADGLQNFGPATALAASHETPNTPKATLSAQIDPQNLVYFTYAKGFRAGGGNPPLPGFCSTDLQAEGFPNGAPLTYKSDSTNSFELGSKNAIGRNFKVATSVYYIRWNGIQQNVYVGGACGLQFTDNLATAVAKGFDVQAEWATGPMKFDFALGYTDARYTAAASAPGPCLDANGNPIPCQPLANVGDAVSGEAAINYSPGLTAPWTATFGAQYEFHAGDWPAFVRLDYEFQARNHWPSTLQDPNSSQYSYGTYTLPSNTFVQARAQMTVNHWALAFFIDNLLNSHTVTNYELNQPDPYNPVPPSRQENDYTFRPRTFGVNATLHL